jgi:hypothetical protein
MTIRGADEKLQPTQLTGGLSMDSAHRFFVFVLDLAEGV